MSWKLGLLCVFGLLWAGSSVAPADEIELVESTLSDWRSPTGDWLIAGGVAPSKENPKLLESTPGTGVLVNGAKGKTSNLVSAEEFGDVEVHVEFMIPEGSNSGIYFMGRYEIQVLDSFGKTEITFQDCGGVYQWYDEKAKKGGDGVPPRTNVCKAPGEWQGYDIVFRAPRFDEQGNKIRDAVFEKVVFNGTVIHENISVPKPTRSPTYKDEKATGPFTLQGDHGPVAYRNFRVKPLNK